MENLDLSLPLHHIQHMKNSELPHLMQGNTPSQETQQGLIDVVKTSKSSKFHLDRTHGINIDIIYVCFLDHNKLDV